MTASDDKRSPEDIPMVGKTVVRPSPQKVQEVSTSDQFLQFSSKLVGSVYNHRGPIVIGIVAIFAIAGAFSAYNAYQDSRNQKASAAAYKVTSVLPADDPLGGMGVDLSDVPRSPEEQKERTEKLVAAAAQLDKVASDFGGQTEGILARLKQAEFLTQAEKLDDAIGAYKKALEQGKSEPLFRFRAMNGMGNLLRKQEKYGEAIQQYQTITGELKGIWRQQGMLELARTHEQQKDYAKAAKVYEDFLKEFPDAPQTKDAEVALVVAKAGGPKAAPAPAPAPEGAAPAAGTEGAPVDPAVPATAPAPAAAPATAPAPAAAAPAAPATAPAAPPAAPAAPATAPAPASQGK